MASEVEICNLALGQVRGGSINNINQQIPAAQYCKLYYPVARDFLLESGPWNFNRRQAPLAILMEEVFNWSYVYDYPVDCMKIEKIIPDVEFFRAADPTVSAVAISGMYDPLAPRTFENIPTVQYQVQNLEGGKVILCNEPRARALYRVSVTDVALFPEGFYMAVAALLATYLAIPMAGVKDGAALKSLSQQNFSQLVSQATLTNANEQQQNVRESEFITVRGGW